MRKLPIDCAEQTKNWPRIWSFRCKCRQKTIVFINFCLPLLSHSPLMLLLLRRAPPEVKTPNVCLNNFKFTAFYCSRPGVSMPTLPYGGDARESRRPTSAFIETRCPNARAFQAERETYLVEPFVTVAN